MEHGSRVQAVPEQQWLREAARDDLAATGDGVGLVVVEGFLLLAADADSGHSGGLPLLDAVVFLDCP